jgi:hypothetical protein
MSDYLVGSSLYFQRAIKPREGLSLIRRAVETLGEYHGAPLRPYLPEQAEILTRMDLGAFEASGYLLILNHECLAAETGQSTFLVNVAYSEPGRNITQIQIFFAMSLEGPDLARVWRCALEWMPVFVEATGPSLAVLNAIPDTEYHPDFLPPEAQVRPRAFPPFFVPWNYLGPERLDEERRRFLQSLPVANSAPFGEGWVLQVVRELTDRPSEGFLTLLARAPGESRVEYRQPEVD